MSETEATFTRSKSRKKQAAQIAEAVVSKMEQEEPTNFDFAGEESNLDEATAIPEVDIFEDIAKRLIKTNDFPTFSIDRNGGHLVTTKKSDINWDTLRRDYGPGSYKVICRSSKTGQIVKTQSKELADLSPNSSGSNERNAPQFTFGETHQQQGFDNSPKQPSFMEIFLLKSDLEEKSRQREREMEAKLEMRQKEIEARLAEAEKGKESSSTEMMKLIMTMQAESAKQMQMIMMESNKTQMTLMTTLLAKAGEKKEDSLKAHELAKMLGDAEKNGYTRWKDISEMVDKKAEARAEEIAAQSGDGDESLTKTLVKGFIPIISQAMQNQGIGGAPGAPQIPQYTPQQLEHMRLQENNRRIQAENQRLAKQREAKIRAEQARQKEFASNPGQATAQGKDIPGMPKIVETPELTPRETMNGHFKQHIQTLVLPIIAEDLTNSIACEVSAERCLRLLGENKISRKDVLDNFKLVDIIGIVKQFDLPVETTPWFEGFYACLEGKTRNAPGLAPENSPSNAP